MGRSTHRIHGDSLPAEATTFVGRRRELAQARELLSASRLLTLTGPGGVGKTRLALRIADQARRAFPDGVVLVELAEVQSAELVPHAVAQALGLRDERSGWTETALAERLSDQHLLLVLDSCEHLIVACALLVRQILARAPEVHVVATSREALKVGGEHTYPVAPLPVPARDAVPSAADLSQYDGVALFLDRAAARVPGFVMTELDAPYIAEIVQQLDGIPLAIELAADRVRALPAAQISARLSSRLRFLTTGDRSASARHQTLFASIKWSYDLCSEAEQQLWARLSVFPSSFVVSAAESVCAGVDVPENDIVDLLTELVEKSVLSRDDDGGAEARYRMLGAIREFGYERLLDSGGADAARDRLVAWCSSLAADYHESWFGPGQPEWLARLRAEHQNVATAIRFALDDAKPEVAMRIVSDLYSHWTAVGLISEGRHWLRRGVEESEPGAECRATALRWLAYFSFYLGDRGDVPQLLADARAELGPEPAPADLAHLFLVEGLTRLADADAHTAQKPLAESLRLFELCDDVAGRAHVLLSYGFTQWLCGELASAQTLLEQCLVLTGQHAERTFHSSALLHLGMVLWDAGEPEAAESMVLEGLELKVQDEEYVSQAVCLEALAWFSVGGNPRRAATLAGCARTAWQRSGTSIVSVDALRRLRDESLEKLHRSLTESEFSRAVAAGEKLSAAQALAFAKGASDTSTSDEDLDAIIQPLTRREWQVARQVAHGLGNRQIASRLAISQRTVDAHVAHILQKLAFGSRSQVAAWVTDRLRLIRE